MAIIFNESTNEFHLFNNEISYIIKVMKNNQLENLYFGKHITHRECFNHLIEREPRAFTSVVYEGDQSFSLDHIKQEYPSYGTTDYRYPSHQITRENGSTITNFEYVSHNIYKGKKSLRAMPCTYVEDENEATTLEIKLFDNVLTVELMLSYTIFESYGAIARSASFVNLGDEKLVLNSAMSASLDLPDDNYDMIHLAGAWARERHVKTRKLQPGVQSIYSIRGASSSNHNPFLALKRPETTEDFGDVYGFSLVYSGNFLAQVDVDSYSASRISIGINPFNFSWNLEKQEIFQTPEAVLVYSDRGLNGMSQTFHNLYRTRLSRGYFRDRVRPILINNWEATYFDFDEEKILSLAKQAKNLGVELFVLDDGWFGKRNGDNSSLGDWYPNFKKLPKGIGDLSNKINALGLEFGLWFEPEMVSSDSHIFEEHPDWVIHTPERRMSQGRNQFVLDFSRKDVVDYVFGMMNKVLSNASISYIKWDMNRNITEAYSHGLEGKKQGEFMHRYILGVYDLYDRLIAVYPKILFESCSGGGNRFDPGMLYYAPQAWTSDDTDAIERLKIQYGTSMVYPITSIGSHVSAVPNHQVNRITPIDTRASVAYFGTFGYELDLNNLVEEERMIIKKQINFFKTHRELIQKGDFYRLISPFEGDGNETAWMVVSKDRKQALVGHYTILSKPNDIYRRFKLKGLNEDFCYEIEQKNTTHYGDELMNIGIILSKNYAGNEIEYVSDFKNKRDFMSRLFILRAKCDS
ncbi:alpha-galactosidase [Clostridium sp.]|uniref:alpha-galactosidase n=1 Tax=Clostridium sp. TaxID=1506 RepID=UPI001A4A099B|nr:alpha-galactosidase [Clostridium sp.]MBK5236728.1 alpha-galactosidase [Clostridium sp.]